MSLHIFSSINMVVCSHCTLQASLMEVILYLRVLLFIFISLYNLYALVVKMNCS